MYTLHCLLLKMTCLFLSMMSRRADPNFVKIMGVYKLFLMLYGTLECKMKVKSNMQRKAFFILCTFECIDLLENYMILLREYLVRFIKYVLLRQCWSRFINEMYHIPVGMYVFSLFSACITLITTNFWTVIS